jgi:L,D-peptidoglycan transpeptidase YkuD (ErfK/YbiS/YcfS/YnhG family)
MIKFCIPTEENMTIFIKNKHTLQVDDFKFKCSIGKNGTTKHKKEGDKKTPKRII